VPLACYAWNTSELPRDFEIGPRRSRCVGLSKLLSSVGSFATCSEKWSLSSLSKVRLAETWGGCEPHAIRSPPPPFLDSRRAGSTTPPESSDRLYSEERRIMAPASGNLPRDLQCGQPSGTSAETFPSTLSRCCLRYAAHAFSTARASSFGAISNRASARIKARTLTWGSAPGPLMPHLRQVIIGVRIFRLPRIR